MCESAHELGDKTLSIPATMHTSKLVLPGTMSALSQNNEGRTGEPALERGTGTTEASKRNLRPTAHTMHSTR